MEYVKINSLWKRQEYVKGLPKGTHGPLIIGQYSETEFGNIKKWHVEEKVDGTNVRIFYSGGNVHFGGRTDNAQMPTSLIKYLQDNFGDWNLSKVFSPKENEPYPTVTLFGEGYGPKIQAAGGNYRSDPGFILFDVNVGGWWLKREDVYSIAVQLGIPHCPDLGLMTEEEIIEFVKSKPMSRCSNVPQMMEGVVCRSDPLVLFRNGRPLMWKLKCREFL